MLTAGNPDFFAGTAVADAVKPFVGRQPRLNPRRDGPPTLGELG